MIHTTNPSNGNEEEVYAELVAGLGEAIVSGMVPGASLSFVGNKADLDNPTVRAACVWQGSEAHTGSSQKSGALRDTTEDAPAYVVSNM